MKIKTAIRRIFGALCYDIHVAAIGPGKLRTRIGQSYSLIRQLGFHPRTVIDVGVASGTPELYQAFPEAYFLLIEPLPHFRPSLIAAINRYDGDYVLAAAGSHAGEAIMNVHTSHLEGSSLYKESMGSEMDGYETTVPMVMIDDLVRDRSLNGPYLIKVDTQGAELDALKGAPITLEETEVVAIEVSLFEFMKGAPQFYDVVSFMKAKGFAAYDIVLGWNRPLDDALGQVDMVFVRENGMFRSDHAYSKPDR